jgi:hypothetical protein
MSNNMISCDLIHNAPMMLMLLKQTKIIFEVMGPDVWSSPSFRHLMVTSIDDVIAKAEGRLVEEKVEEVHGV